MAFDAASPAAMSLPLPMVIESFKDQLDTFRVTLPAHLAASRECLPANKRLAGPGL